MKNKEELARLEGARWILEYAEKNGLEEAKKQLEWRGAYNVPIKASESQVQEFINYTKDNCVKTVCCMAAMVLRDEFGFGRERLNRFVERFNGKAECLTSDFVRWQDIQDSLKEETGIDFYIPGECEVHNDV